jgi:hypothetical protein
MKPIDNIPDWDKRLARQDAFWDRQIIDRPVIQMSVPNRSYVAPQRTPKVYSSIRERWMDTEAVVQNTLDYVAGTLFLGDALPGVFPNLGPEILSAFMGCELEYSEGTAWAVPNLEDWKNVDHIKFSEDNFYWKKILELTDALMEAGQGKFYTGFTDLHPGADAIAAFRDPLNLNFDMIEAKDDVVALLAKVTEVYFQVYDFYYNKFKANDQAITSWPGIVSSRKWYVPSNDFSCMVSKEMFDEVFLPGIIEECQFMEANIYHLDGPDALRHLDSLLDIKELNAIQWVYGAGNNRASDWIPVYKKIQAAGKGMQAWIEPDELDIFKRELKPEGVWLGVFVPDEDTANSVLKSVESWV